ncbi:hypothetical protein AVEN_209340-1 [Araneus ventricosus]|uniref:Uncharacterized protein n=1 Tax=Araneus ventricosus TaxID=182803 RepID=A0A4Y2CAR6_ARAVE|nr:hypothetical protein AVEN_209340-1 [Araneus ventricosus]
MKRRTYRTRRQHRRESPHTSQRQETISRVCFKKSPSSAGKKNWTVEKHVCNVLPKVKAIRTPWQRPEIMFVMCHGPFSTYLKRFNIRNLWLRKPGKSLTLCCKLPVFDPIPPNKTLS